MAKEASRFLIGMGAVLLFTSIILSTQEDIAAATLFELGGLLAIGLGVWTSAARLMK